MSFYLEPVGLASEHLNQIDIDTSSNNSIILGRNPATVKPSSYDIKYIEYVSRKQAELVIINSSIYIKPLTLSDGGVSVNGVPCAYNNLNPLSVGDTFSLLGSHGYFNFKLRSQKKRKVDSSSSPGSVAQRSPNPNPHSSNAAVVKEPTQSSSQSNSQSVVYVGKSPHRSTRSKTSENIEFVGTGTTSSSSSALAGLKPSSQITESAPPAVHSVPKIEQHLECAICFNHIALAHTINPCGCVFCFECITSWSSRKNTCPNCISEFQTGTMSPNRVIDNIIRDLLESQAGSSADGARALQEWEERVSQGKALKKMLLEDKAGASSSSSAVSGVKPPTVPATANTMFFHGGPNAVHGPSSYGQPRRNAGHVAPTRVGPPPSSTAATRGVITAFDFYGVGPPTPRLNETLVDLMDSQQSTLTGPRVSGPPGPAAVHRAQRRQARSGNATGATSSSSGSKANDVIDLT